MARVVPAEDADREEPFEVGYDSEAESSSQEEDEDDNDNDDNDSSYCNSLCMSKTSLIASLDSRPATA